LKKITVVFFIVFCFSFFLTCSTGAWNSGDSDIWIGKDDALYVDARGFLRNQKGGEVVLRGVNTGGWMVQESWMCPVYGQDREWANMDTIKAMQERGWTAAQIQELFDTYQDNWITTDDFDFFKSRGVNSIRVPFWYRNFMTDEEGTWINNDNGSYTETANPGFRRLDWAITQAKKRGMYVILDLHGAPGGQSADHCTGTLGKNELWVNPVYEQATVDLWLALAGRYKDEPAVAGYDLLNEPMNNGGTVGPSIWAPGTTRAVHETVRVYDRLYREIRKIDPDTIIIMETVWDMHLPDPKYAHNGPLDINDRFSGKTVPWDKNIMYSMHVYDHGRDFDSSVSQSSPPARGSIDFRVWELTEARKKWGVGVHIGEFNNDAQGNQYDAYRLYNSNKINWNMWTYKIGGSNMGNWSLFQSPYRSNANPMTDSFETIKNSRWGESIRTFRRGTNTAINDYSQTDMLSVYSSGQRQRIVGVINAPIGGASGPVLADDNDTGSGLAAGAVTRKMPAKPVINPSTMTFNTAGRQNITITCADANAVIRYTVNGLTPSRDSALYTGAFALDAAADKTAVVRARSFTEDGVSSTAHAAYTVRKTAVPSFSSGEAWPDGPFNLSIRAEGGAEIWYSLNGGVYTLFTSPINIASSVTVTSYAVRSAMSKSETVSRVYKFGTPPKMYHNFASLDGVRAGNYANVSNADSDWEYSPNGKAAAMTVLNSGMPGMGERSLVIAPEGGGVFDASGFNYMIIVFKDPANNSYWININRDSSGAVSGWSDHKNIAASPASSSAGQWVMSAIPVVNTGMRINNITFGQYNANTYLIDCIYFAVNADDPPKR